jgi:hypothetical protein
MMARSKCGRILPTGGRKRKVQREEKVESEWTPENAGYEKSVKLVKKHLPASSRETGDVVERRREDSDTMSCNDRLEEAARAD